MKNGTGFGKHQHGAGPVIASVLLHLVAAGIVLLFPPRTHLEPPREIPVTVDVFTPQQFQAIRNESSRIEPSTDTTVLSGRNSTVTAENILSGSVLNEPGNEEARISLSKLSGDTRLEQLCIIEAMEQIHHWRSDIKPEWIVTSVRSETQTIDSTYFAEGAAFRQEDRWYDLSFKCEATPSLEEVVAFEFTVGEHIPPNQLERHRLFIGPDSHAHD